MTEEEMINILSHGNETRNVMPEGRKKEGKEGHFTDSAGKHSKHEERIIHGTPN